MGAVCLAGTAALLLTFCSEALFRDRGFLDQSLMTWEDFYGPVVTTFLAVGLLCVPFRAFAFRSGKVWLGSFAAAGGLTAAVYVMVAPVELSGFHAENFMVAVGLLSFIGFLCAFAGVHGSTRLAAPDDGPPGDLPGSARSPLS